MLKGLERRSEYTYSLRHLAIPWAFGLLALEFAVCECAAAAPRQNVIRFGLCGYNRHRVLSPLIWPLTGIYITIQQSALCIHQCDKCGIDLTNNDQQLHKRKPFDQYQFVSD